MDEQKEVLTDTLEQYWQTAHHMDEQKKKSWPTHWNNIDKHKDGEKMDKF